MGYNKGEPTGLSV